MKIKYETPEIDVLVLGVKDAITTTSLGTENRWSPGEGGSIEWGDIWS